MTLDPLARRSFLAGISALPAVTIGGVALARPDAAAAARVYGADADLIAEMTRLYEAAIRRSAAACRACENAEERLVYPPVPEVLFQRPDEPLHGYIMATDRFHGRYWYGTKRKIADLRAWPMTQPGWEQRRQRRDEILNAYDQWQADIEAAEDAAGMTAADAEYRAAYHEEEKPIRLRILELRSTDPAALRLKVRAYLSSVSALDWRESLDDGITKAIDAENGPWEDAMAASILRDVVTALAPADA